MALLAAQASLGASNVTSSQNSQIAQVAATQGSSTGRSLNLRRIALTEIAGARPVPNSVTLGGLTTGIVTSTGRAGGNTANRRGLNPNLANVVLANLGASGNPSLINSTLNTISNGTTTGASSTANNGVVFTNIGTAPGTSQTNGVGLPNGNGVVFTNIPTTPGAITNVIGANNGSGISSVTSLLGGTNALSNTGQVTTALNSLGGNTGQLTTVLNTLGIPMNSLGLTTASTVSPIGSTTGQTVLNQFV